VIIADVVIVVHAIPLIVAHGIRKDAVILPPIKEQKPTFPQNHSPPKTVVQYVGHRVTMSGLVPTALIHHLPPTFQGRSE